MLLLGCLAGLGFSLSGLFTGRRPRPARPAAAERALHELRAGDIVQHGSSFLGCGGRCSSPRPAAGGP